MQLVDGLEAKSSGGNQSSIPTQKMDKISVHHTPFSESTNPFILILTSLLLDLLLPSETEGATCSRSDLSSLSPPLGLTHNMNSALLGARGVIQYSCDKTQNLYVRYTILALSIFY